MFSRNSATINEPDRLLGHELAAQMDRVISRMIESSSLRAKHPGAVSGLSFSHVQHPNNGLDYLSTGVPKGLPLHMTVSNTRGNHARNSEPLEESEIETPHYLVEKELDHPFLADRILPVLGTNDSNESEGSVSESESSTISERGMQALSARSRLYFHQKQKAVELRANGRSMAGIFEHLVADSDETGLEFCQNMWKLCSFFEKAHLLKEALIGLELVQAGYDIEFGAASKETMRCFVRKARILRRMKEYRDSEALYRQAIAGFKALRQRLSQIKCQLILGNFLRVLGRDSEALHFLLEAIIENFVLAKTTEESRKVVELLDSVQRLHHKMELGPDFADNIFQLQIIQQQWVEAPHHLKLWTEFVGIGAHYSKLKKFELADLCFTIPAPIRSPNNPATRIQLLKCGRELSMHYKRQGKLIQSIEQLENALQHFSALIHQKSFERTDFQRTLVMTEALEQELFAALGELLVVTKPSEMQPVVQESDKVPLLAMWMRAEAAWSKLDAHRRLFQHKPLRNSHIDNLRDRETMERNDTASISSHGSSMFSGGSTSSRIGITYSVGSASSIVSNSAFMVPS
jgi:tetratricopeptide (TPR) repeat protein